MILWRISNPADLLGSGGIQVAGRWHNRGLPIVYLAESPALAMLEVLVHFELSLVEIPGRYQLLEVEYPQRRAVSHLREGVLEEGWLEDLEFTRSVGDEWLVAANAALLKVPSAIVPGSFNYLLNPRHAAAKKARVISVTAHPYDPRSVSGQSDSH